MRRPFSKFSRMNYRLARASRDASAISRSVAAASPKPIIRRITNKLIGRTIARRLWWR